MSVSTQFPVGRTRSALFFFVAGTTDQGATAARSGFEDLRDRPILVGDAGPWRPGTDPGGSGQRHRPRHRPPCPDPVRSRCAGGSRLFRDGVTAALRDDRRLAQEMLFGEAEILCPAHLLVNGATIRPVPCRRDHLCAHHVRRARRSCWPKGWASEKLLFGCRICSRGLQRTLPRGDHGVLPEIMLRGQAVPMTGGPRSHER